MPTGGITTRNGAIVSHVALLGAYFPPSVGVGAHSKVRSDHQSERFLPETLLDFQAYQFC